MWKPKSCTKFSLFVFTLISDVYSSEHSSHTAELPGRLDGFLKNVNVRKTRYITGQQSISSSNVATHTDVSVTHITGHSNKTIGFIHDSDSLEKNL
jgi:hypothetical protein